MKNFTVFHNLELEVVCMGSGQLCHVMQVAEHDAGIVLLLVTLPGST